MLGFYELFKPLSLEVFNFFPTEAHKIGSCSTEINSVYVRETVPATAGFAFNPVSRCLMLLWLSLVYFLSSKW